MRAERNATQVEQQYQGKQGEAYHQLHAVPQASHAWIAQSRCEKLAPYIKPDDVVLEYGVGPGWNLEAICCKQRLGYDLAAFLKDQLSAKGIEFVPDIREQSDASIDAVICHHVLEHTLDPARVLVEINRLLRDAGKLVLVVPYEKERKYRIYNPGEPNHHLYSWNVQSLGNLVEGLGFTVEAASIGKYGYDRFIAVWASRLRMGAAGFRALKKLALALMPLYEVRIVASKKGRQR
jgi:SAM-dependent methyltransferase